MEISETISRIAEEMGIPLEERDKKVYRKKGALSSLQMAEVYHNGEYYGYLVLAENDKGQMKYCAYTGKHPILIKTGDSREELGLHLERDEQGEFRVDSNPTKFLGWDIVDTKKESKDEEKRRLPYLIGMCDANCHESNHRLQRQHQQQA